MKKLFIFPAKLHVFNLALAKLKRSGILLTFIFFSFSAHADYWTQKASFTTIGRYATFSFSIGNKGYVGGGSSGTVATTYDDFWEYDPLANVWTQKANFGGSNRKYATGFSIGNKGYAGLGYGYIPVFAIYHDFWEYDPSINTWTQKADFGGLERFNAIGFSCGIKGYMGLGDEDDDPPFFSDLWEYDQPADTWVQKASFPPGGRMGVNCFSYGNCGYTIGGWSVWNDVWEYNTLTDTWTQMANFPGGWRNDGASFIICDKGYFGVGDSLVLGTPVDFWQYDFGTNTWLQKTDFAGPGRFYSAFFSIGTKGYLGFGSGLGSGNLYSDFWEYTPDSVCATGIEEAQVSSASGRQFSISPNPAKEFIVINCQVKEKINLTVTGEDGKEVLTSVLRPQSPVLRLPISSLQPGIYFIKAGNEVKKFVKQ